MTIAELREMDYGDGDYLGEPWIEACRCYLNEIRLAWQYLKDDQQRRDVQEGIRSMMDEIATRKNATSSLDVWNRFRAECGQLTSDWNDLWFFGWEKSKAVPGKVG
jgi:hypothetical protein